MAEQLTTMLIDGAQSDEDLQRLTGNVQDAPVVDPAASVDNPGGNTPTGFGTDNTITETAPHSQPPAVDVTTDIPGPTTYDTGSSGDVVIPPQSVMASTNEPTAPQEPVLSNTVDTGGLAAIPSIPEPTPATAPEPTPAPATQPTPAPAPEPTPTPNPTPEPPPAPINSTVNLQYILLEPTPEGELVPRVQPDGSLMIVSGTDVPEGTPIGLLASVDKVPAGTGLVLNLQNYGPIIIPQGQNSAYILIGIRPDDLYAQGSETQSNLIISHSGGGYDSLSYGPPVSVAVVDDQDPTIVRLSHVEPQIEDGSSVSYTLSVNHAPQGSDLVLVVTVNGVEQQVTIKENATESEPFSVPTRVDDVYVQGETTTNVSVKSWSGGRYEAVDISGAHDSFTTTDDSDKTILRVEDVTVTEGQVANIQLSLDQRPLKDLSVDVMVAGQKIGTAIFSKELPPSLDDLYRTSVSYLTTALPHLASDAISSEITLQLSSGADQFEELDFSDTATLNVNDVNVSPFAPQSTSIINQTNSASLTRSLDSDLTLSNNVGPDGIGSLKFASIVEGDPVVDSAGNQLTYLDPSTKVVYSLVYHLGSASDVLVAYADKSADGKYDSSSDITVFTISLDKATSEYTLSLSEAIGSSYETTLKNFSAAGLVSGNVPFNGNLIQNSSAGILYSSSYQGAQATVNVSTTGIGTNNQSMDPWETIRLDFVTNLSVGPQGRYYDFDQYATANLFSFQLTQVQKAAPQGDSLTAINIKALDVTLPDSADPAGTSAAQHYTALTDPSNQHFDTITSAWYYTYGNTPAPQPSEEQWLSLKIYNSLAEVPVNTLTPYAVYVHDVQGAPCSINVFNLNVYDFVRVETLDGFSAVEITNAEASNSSTADKFDIGFLGLSLAIDYVKTPQVTLSVPVALSDADADSQTASISVTLNSPTPGPVALDLNHNGAIEYLSLGDSSVSFAYGDQHALFAWVAPSDGVLFYDYDHSGAISDAKEFVFTLWGGDPTVHTDMQALLSYFDDSADHSLNSLDSKWAQFCVWQDTNNNAFQDHGEVRSLADIGIASIDLVYSSTSSPGLFANGDVQVYGQMQVNYLMGGHGLAEDASFAVSALPALESPLISVSALSSLDSSRDGQIDSLDNSFSMLYLWNDSNHDGSVGANELVLLRDAHVASVALIGSLLAVSQSGDHLHVDGSAQLTYDDGASALVQDLHLVSSIDQSPLTGSTASSPSVLSHWDSDGNGILSSRDVHYADLSVWCDRNSDGAVDPNELTALQDSHVHSIDLTGTGLTESTTAAHVHLDGSATVTYDDGTSAVVQDLHLAVLIDHVIADPAVLDATSHVSSYDSNADGSLTSADAFYANFNVWHDQNGDGVVDANELTALQESHIHSIDLSRGSLTEATTDTHYHLDGSAAVGFDDGSSAIVHDLHLAALIDHVIADPSVLDSSAVLVAAPALDTTVASTTDLSHTVNTFLATEPVTDAHLATYEHDIALSMDAATHDTAFHDTVTTDTNTTSADSVHATTPDSTVYDPTHDVTVYDPIHDTTVHDTTTYDHVV